MSSDYDSDDIDSDTEVKLWSRIYHEPSNADAHECTLGSYMQLLSKDSSDSSSVPSSSSPVCNKESSQKQPLVNGSNPRNELNDASFSSDNANNTEDSDDEPSKSQLMSGMVARGRRPLAASPSICFIDIASSDDSSDDEILILSDTTNGLKPDLVNIKSNRVQSFNSPNIDILKKRDTSSPSPIRSKRLNGGPSKAELALNAFLARCRPEYTPHTGDVNNNEDEEARREERKKKKEQKMMKRHSGEVSLDLLNSLPGSSNRFKRIRKNSEEADLWRVDAEDLPGFKSTLKNKERRRYYSHQKRCETCKEFTDHTSKECPRGASEPTCLICGTSGHIAESCSRKFCTRCCRQGHTSGNCHKHFASNTCDLCGFSGHLSDNCPTIWRKYHTTVTHSSVKPIIDVNVPVNKRIFCCFCGAHGHFAFECRLYAHGKAKVISSPLFYASPRTETMRPPSRSKKRRGDKHTVNGKRKCASEVTDLPSNAKRARQLLNGHVSSSNAIARSNIQQETGSGDAPPLIQGCKMKKKKKKKKSNQTKQSTDQGDRINSSSINMNVIVDTNNLQPSKRITRAQRKLINSSQSNESSTTGQSTVTSAIQSDVNSHVITQKGKVSKAEKKQQLAAALTNGTLNEEKSTTSSNPPGKQKKKKNKKKGKLSQHVTDCSTAQVDQPSSSSTKLTLKSHESSDASHKDKASSSSSGSGVSGNKKKLIAHSNGMKLSR